MSIKDFFRNKRTSRTKLKTLGDKVVTTDQTESIEYLQEFRKSTETYYPPIDYSDPKNFARYSDPFSSSETTIKKIYEEYPYDGTLAEKQKWENKNGFLDRHIFEREYPRRVGFVSISSDGYGALDDSKSTFLYDHPVNEEYIEFFGGPHSSKMKNNIRTQSNSINPLGSNRRSNKVSWDETTKDFSDLTKSNLYASGTAGNTIEFWFKKDHAHFEQNQLDNSRMVIFDMWNGVDVSDDSVNANYGRIRIEYSEYNSVPQFVFTYISPSSNDENAVIVSRGVLDCSFDHVSNRSTDFYSDWHHVAFSVKNHESDLHIKFYVDGDLIEQKTAVGQASAVIPGPHMATIGSMVTRHELDSLPINISITSPADYYTNIGYSFLAAGSPFLGHPLAGLVLNPAGFRENSSGLLNDAKTGQLMVKDETALFPRFTRVIHLGDGQYQATNDSSAPLTVFENSDGSQWATAAPTIDQMPYGFYQTGLSIWQLGLTQQGAVNDNASTGNYRLTGADPMPQIIENVFFGQPDGSPEMALWSHANTTDEILVDGVVERRYLLTQKIDQGNGNFTYGAPPANLKQLFFDAYGTEGEEIIGLIFNAQNNVVLQAEIINNVGLPVRRYYAPRGQEYNDLNQANVLSTKGSGKLAGSIDDFRFWRSYRTSRQIGRWHSQQIGGGTNDVSNNNSLGVYYKFNEGIFGTEVYDSNVIDYSGRGTNAEWYGKPIGKGRTEVSAIESRYSNRIEFKDPILYGSHPDVLKLVEDKKTAALQLRNEFSSQLWRHLPSYIIDTNAVLEKNTQSDLRNLLNIVGSYLDELWLQIQAINDIKSNNYDKFDKKPAPFLKRMLEHSGLQTPDIFIDSTVHELLHAQSDDVSYERDITEVKNLIYQNIYSNLAYINKSKGTMEGFNSLVRCFGIDDEILKVNLYATDTEYTFEDNYKLASFRRPYLDFYDDKNTTAIVYQRQNPDPDQAPTDSSLDYIPAFLTQESADFKYSLAFETEFMFPKRSSVETSSLFGCYAWDIENNTIDTSEGTADFRVTAEGRTSSFFEGVRFHLEVRIGNQVLTTSSQWFDEVYNETKWNLGVSIQSRVPGFGSPTNASFRDSDIIFKLMGCHAEANSVLEEFSVELEIPVEDAIKIGKSNLKCWAGAVHGDQTNNGFLPTFDTTAPLEYPCNANLGFYRVWLASLNENEIRQHAVKPLNYGVDNPMFSIIPLEFPDILGEKNIEIPKAQALILNWEFANVAGSDENGEFWVSDYSAGKPKPFHENRTPDQYSILEKLSTFYTAKGVGFAPNTDGIIDNRYIFAGRLSLPESVSSDDTIRILSKDDEVFTLDSRPKRMFIAVEKSMYQSVSQEMLKVMHSVTEFGNLIGHPVDKYRSEYKDLSKLSELFFRNIGNTPSLEKYLNFYKWIDSSLSEMLMTLMPATADQSFGEGVKNTIESHAFERSKYRHKFPELVNAGEPPETVIRGARELAYNWKIGHAPIEMIIPDTVINTMPAGTIPSVENISQQVHHIIDFVPSGFEFSAGTVDNTDPANPQLVPTGLIISFWFKAPDASEDYVFASKQDEYFVGVINGNLTVRFGAWDSVNAGVPNATRIELEHWGLNANAPGNFLTGYENQWVHLLVHERTMPGGLEDFTPGQKSRRIEIYFNGLKIAGDEAHMDPMELQLAGNPSGGPLWGAPLVVTDDDASFDYVATDPNDFYLKACVGPGLQMADLILAHNQSGLDPDKQFHLRDRNIDFFYDPSYKKEPRDYTESLLELANGQKSAIPNIDGTFDPLYRFMYWWPLSGEYFGPDAYSKFSGSGIRINRVEAVPRFDHLDEGHFGIGRKDLLNGIQYFQKLESSPFSIIFANPDRSSLWWSERIKRTSEHVTSGNSEVDIDREELREAIVFQTTNDLPDGVKAANNINLDKTSKDVPEVFYLRDPDYPESRISHSFPYPYRRLNKHMMLDVSRQTQLSGGSNFEGNKRNTLYKSVIRNLGGTESIVVDFNTIVDRPRDDEANVGIKRRLHALAYVGDLDSSIADSDSNLIAPFSIYETKKISYNSESNSIDNLDHSFESRSGYASQLEVLKAEKNLDITNLHVDSYGDDRAIPLQGPFPSTHVGGHQHRNVPYMSPAKELRDGYLLFDRPEAFDLMVLGTREVKVSPLHPFDEWISEALVEFHFDNFLNRRVQIVPHPTASFNQGGEFVDHPLFLVVGGPNHGTLDDYVDVFFGHEHADESYSLVFEAANNPLQINGAPVSAYRFIRTADKNLRDDQGLIINAIRQDKLDAFKRYVGTLNDFAYITNRANVASINPKHHIRTLATHMRDEFAKRPVNIRNIPNKYIDLIDENSQPMGARVVLGNYRKQYEVFQAGSRSVNNRDFIENTENYSDLENSHIYNRSINNLLTEDIFPEKYYETSAPYGNSTRMKPVLLGYYFEPVFTVDGMQTFLTNENTGASPIGDLSLEYGFDLTENGWNPIVDDAYLSLKNYFTTPKEDVDWAESFLEVRNRLHNPNGADVVTPEFYLIFTTLSDRISALQGNNLSANGEELFQIFSSNVSQTRESPHPTTHETALLPDYDTDGFSLIGQGAVEVEHTFPISYTQSPNGVNFFAPAWFTDASGQKERWVTSSVFQPNADASNHTSVLSMQYNANYDPLIHPSRLQAVDPFNPAAGAPLYPASEFSDRVSFANGTGASILYNLNTNDTTDAILAFGHSPTDVGKNKVIGFENVGQYDLDENTSILLPSHFNLAEITEAFDSSETDLTVQFEIIAGDTTIASVYGLTAAQYPDVNNDGTPDGPIEAAPAVRPGGEQERDIGVNNQPDYFIVQYCDSQVNPLNNNWQMAGFLSGSDFPANTNQWFPVTFTIPSGDNIKIRFISTLSGDFNSDMWGIRNVVVTTNTGAAGGAPVVNYTAAKIELPLSGAPVVPKHSSLALDEELYDPNNLTISFKFAGSARHLPGRFDQNHINAGLKDKLEFIVKTTTERANDKDLIEFTRAQISVDKNALNAYTSAPQNNAKHIVSPEYHEMDLALDENWASFEFTFPAPTSTNVKQTFYILKQVEIANVLNAAFTNNNIKYYFKDIEVKYAKSSVTNVDYLNLADKNQFKTLRQIADINFRKSTKVNIPREPSGDHIIVERFSSPGDIYTMGDGSLDRLSGQYSPYNALSFRNRKLSNILNIESSKVYNGQYSDSIIPKQQIHDVLVDGTLPVHKTHRNNKYRLEIIEQVDGYPIPLGYLDTEWTMTHGAPLTFNIIDTDES